MPRGATGSMSRLERDDLRSNRSGATNPCAQAERRKRAEAGRSFLPRASSFQRGRSGSELEARSWELILRPWPRSEAPLCQSGSRGCDFRRPLAPVVQQQESAVDNRQTSVRLGPGALLRTVLPLSISSWGATECELSFAQYCLYRSVLALLRRASTSPWWPKAKKTSRPAVTRALAGASPVGHPNRIRLRGASGARRSHKPERVVRLHLQASPALKAPSRKND